jgi:hypothetical protein
MVCDTEHVGNARTQGFSVGVLLADISVGAGRVGSAPLGDSLISGAICAPGGQQP